MKYLVILLILCSCASSRPRKRIMTRQDQKILVGSFVVGFGVTGYVRKK